MTKQNNALRLANEFKLCNEYDSIPSITDIAKAEAELRRQHARIAELDAELEAVGAGGVQALSAAPEAIAKLRHLYQNMVNGAVRDTASAKRIAEGLLAPAIEALERSTPPAEQQDAPKAAPGDRPISSASAKAAAHVAREFREAAPQQEAQEPTEISEAIERMAADRYKVVPSHESMFHRWAVVAGTGAQQLYLGREVECQNMARKFAGAFLDGVYVALRNAATQPAPQQEAQDSVSPRHPVVMQWRDNAIEACAKIADAYGNEHAAQDMRAMLTAPQPAPAPLSDDVVRDAARWHMAVLIGNEVMMHPDKRTHATAVKAYMDATHSGSDLTGAVDAAIAAQRGNK